MIKIILSITIVLVTMFANAQNNQDLESFFSILSEENLNTDKSRVREINGTVLTTWEMYRTSSDEYYISKIDLVNLQRVKWTTKEEYDELYPEDKSTNADAEFITLFSKKGEVERNSFFTDTDTNVRKAKEGYTEHVTKWTDCNFVNITFKNSTLAAKAKKYLDAYLADQKE